jgi:hypothetical protein
MALVSSSLRIRHIGGKYRRVSASQGCGDGRVRLAKGACSDSSYEPGECPLNGCDICPGWKEGVDVAAEVRRHLRAGLPDDQHIALALKPDEIAGLEDDVVPRHLCVSRILVCEVVVLGEQEDPADAPGGGMSDLVDDRTSGDEVRLPVQNTRSQALEVPLDGCCRIL